MRLSVALCLIGLPVGLIGWMAVHALSYQGPKLCVQPSQSGDLLWPATMTQQEILRAREAEQSFWSIVRSRKLIAGTGGIVGDHKWVCFSEAPIAVLAQMLAPGVGQYAPLGVIVDKVWLFDQGGRPVIYQPRAEYDALPPSHRYRHVNYDPVNEGGAADVTWEREWRVQCDFIPLEPARVTLVVPFRLMVEQFNDQHFEEQQQDAYAAGNAAFQALERQPWHFLVLEDLGLEIEFG